MANERCDIAIVGAGPAGMSAAIMATRHGAAVTVLDEQPAAGGQIYRSVGNAPARRIEILGPDYAAGRTLADGFRASGARHLTGASVWEVGRDGNVHYLSEGASRTLRARHILLCSGAMERPFPIPGWTLPGVLTAGAAQILLKSADVVPAEPVVLAGCGPLLYLLGWQYVRAGVPIAALVDTTSAADYRRALPHLGGALASWRQLTKGLSLIRTLRRAGVPIYAGATRLEVEGRDRATALRFTAGGRQQRVATSTVLLHQGVVPNTQFTWSLRASHRWNEAQLCWHPETDAWGRLDVPSISVAGDGSGIGGAAAAAVQGQLAALGALHSIERITETERDRLAAPLFAKVRSELRIRPFLDALYRPKKENRVPADDVIVCRCEEVTAGAIRQTVELGCLGPNQAKAFLRCGMGPCQGRQCGLTVTELIADSRCVDPAEVGYYRVRSPIKPITFGELAGEAAIDTVS